MIGPLLWAMARLIWTAFLLGWITGKGKQGWSVSVQFLKQIMAEVTAR